MTRIFQACDLQEGALIQLNESASHHLARVLRMNVNDAVTVFNGRGGEFSGVITQIEKKFVAVTLQKFIAREVESPLDLCLAQGISRGEKMDYTIQKAVELGVKKIVPLFTERCNVKLDQERSEKRLQHWQSIIISACEQSGRNRVPDILPPQNLSAWFEKNEADFSFVLSPHVTKKLPELNVQSSARMSIIIGPEGGLSDREVAEAEKHGFLPLNLGPRILRTETAAVAAMTALQCHYGDLS